MTDADRHLMTLFANALELPPGPEREAYLPNACASDAPLRARLDGLLLAHDQAGRFLEQAPAGPTGDWDCLAGATGAVIAERYKLLEEIGEGGMGTVWMAEQFEPVLRRVAL